MSNAFEKLAEKIGIYNQGGIVNVQNLTIEGGTQDSRHNWERYLLDNAESEIYTRLESATASENLELALELQPQTVIRNWDKDIQYNIKKSEILESGTDVLEIFKRKDVYGKLLIHGNPGSGKTSIQLMLARRFLEEFTHTDSKHPIPVFFKLSKWSPEQGLIDFLVTEISEKYKALSKEKILILFQEKRIFLVLDGLDELNSNFQQPCIEAINDFIDSDLSPQYITVSCRSETYLSLRKRLKLNNSIYLKELSLQQIKKYLLKIKKHEYWITLSQNDSLLALAKSPLFLNLIITAFEEFSHEDLRNVNDEKSLLDFYISGMLNKKQSSQAYGSKNMPDSQTTRKYLVWLSQQMARESLVEFLIEKIQPSWLSQNGLIQDYHFLAFQMLSALLGLFFGGLIGLTLFGLSSSITVGVIAFVIVFTLLFLRSYSSFRRSYFTETDESDIREFMFYVESDIRLTESLAWSFTSAIENFFVFLNFYIKRDFGNLFSGIRSNILLSFIFSLAMTIYLDLKIFFFAIIALATLLTIYCAVTMGVVLKSMIIGIAFGVQGGLIRSEIDRKNRANQGIIRTKYFLFLKVLTVSAVGLLVSLVAGMIFGINQSTQYGLLAILLVGFIYSILMSIVFVPIFFILGLFAGLPEISACMKHLLIRRIFYKHGCMPWDYARFLDYCVEIKLLERIGGRYRFIHKLLQEHFAAMPLETSKPKRLSD